MRPAWLEVDLEAYRANLSALAHETGRRIVAVLKANAYGHGAVLLAPEAIAAGCPAVAVAFPEEGAALRESGFRGRILLLVGALKEQSAEIAAHDLEPTISRVEVVEALSQAAAQHGRSLRVHIEVDTGMTRGGVDPGAVPNLCRQVCRDPNLALAGVTTHFAAADDAGGSLQAEQWARFRPVVDFCRRLAPRPLLHAANSAAALWRPETRLDWVRLGLVSYGVNPGRQALPPALSPVGSLKAKIIHVREVGAGTRVSYGGTWTAPKASRLALAPLGYGDGLPWTLSNRGTALIRGERVPIRGRVCMDQVLLEVTDLMPPVIPGEEVVFFGRQGRGVLTAEEVAEKAGTISYELLARLAARLPRVVRR
jgi:alanine racemase